MGLEKEARRLRGFASVARATDDVPLRLIAIDRYQRADRQRQDELKPHL